MKIQTLDQIVTALETGWRVPSATVNRLVLGVEQGIENLAGEPALADEIQSYETALAHLRDAEERLRVSSPKFFIAHRSAVIENLKAARALCPDLSWY
jgi:hypothetical protein